MFKKTLYVKQEKYHKLNQKTLTTLFIVPFWFLTLIFFNRFERVLGPCADILKRNISQYNSFVSLSV